MGFLYGDSTPSPLGSNFLEFLRDALDFSVFVLAADEKIRQFHEGVRANALAADEETQRLEAFGRIVAAAIEGAPKGEPSSESSRCAVQVAGSVAEAVRASVGSVRADLASKRSQAEAEEAAERDACFQALETLLLPHAPPKATLSRHVLRREDGRYTAYQIGAASFGLDWRIDLAIPDDHVLAAPAPLDRMAPHVELSAPEETGWLKKEVKLRPQRLERLVLVEVVDDGTKLELMLRAEGPEAKGIDYVVSAGAVSASRVGAPEDPSVGPFDPPEEDVTKLVSLTESLRASLGELKGSRLVEATLNGSDFRLCPRFESVVESLVALMAPLVQDIARHSLTQTELVLRRALSSERREEIFVAKSVLREKYAPLPAPRRALFGALGLDTLPPPPPEPAAVDVDDSPVIELRPDEPEPDRTELAPSQPPPPRSSSPPPRPSSPD